MSGRFALLIVLGHPCRGRSQRDGNSAHTLGAHEHHFLLFFSWVTNLDLPPVRDCLLARPPGLLVGCLRSPGGEARPLLGGIARARRIYRGPAFPFALDGSRPIQTPEAPMGTGCRGRIGCGQIGFHRHGLNPARFSAVSVFGQFGSSQDSEQCTPALAGGNGRPTNLRRRWAGCSCSFSTASTCPRIRLTGRAPIPA